MSVLAKIFKCCRCQGDPPQPCTTCCVQSPHCGCCQGINESTNKQDEIINYSMAWHVEEAYSSGGSDYETLVNVTATQNGDSAIDTVTEFPCRVIVPVDLVFQVTVWEDEIPITENDCSGTADMVLRRIGLYLNGCQTWDVLPQRVGIGTDPFSNVNVTCSKGSYGIDPFGLEPQWFEYFSFGQLTPDDCDVLSQHNSVSNGNGEPVLATLDESAQRETHIFGCDEEANCACVN